LARLGSGSRIPAEMHLGYAREPQRRPGPRGTGWRGGSRSLGLRGGPSEQAVERASRRVAPHVPAQPPRGCTKRVRGAEKVAGKGRDVSDEESYEGGLPA
jgi:hypothetical protein